MEEIRIYVPVKNLFNSIQFFLGLGVKVRISNDGNQEVAQLIFPPNNSKFNLVEEVSGRNAESRNMASHDEHRGDHFVINIKNREQAEEFCFKVQSSGGKLRVRLWPKGMDIVAHFLIPMAINGKFYFRQKKVIF